MTKHITGCILTSEGWIRGKLGFDERISAIDGKGFLPRAMANRWFCLGSSICMCMAAVVPTSWTAMAQSIRWRACMPVTDDQLAGNGDDGTAQGH